MLHCSNSLYQDFYIIYPTKYLGLKYHYPINSNIQFYLYNQLNLDHDNIPFQVLFPIQPISQPLYYHFHLHISILLVFIFYFYEEDIIQFHYIYLLIMDRDSFLLKEFIYLQLISQLKNYLNNQMQMDTSILLVFLIYFYIISFILFLHNNFLYICYVPIKLVEFIYTFQLYTWQQYYMYIYLIIQVYVSNIFKG